MGSGARVDALFMHLELLKNCRQEPDSLIFVFIISLAMVWRITCGVKRNIEGARVEEPLLNLARVVNLDMDLR